MEQLELRFDLENEQSVTEIHLQICASIEHVIVVEKDSCNYYFLQKNGTKYLQFFSTNSSATEDSKPTTA